MLALLFYIKVKHKVQYFTSDDNVLSVEDFGLVSEEKGGGYTGNIRL